MAHLLSINAALAEAMLITGSFKSLMDTGTLTIYNGTMPANADAALSGNSVLVAMTSLAFAASAPGGVLSKTGTWSGTVVLGGTASFYRFVTGSYIIQGTVSTAGSDLDLTSTVLTLSATQPINAFSISLPLQ